MLPAVAVWIAWAFVMPAHLKFHRILPFPPPSSERALRRVGPRVLRINASENEGTGEGDCRPFRSQLEKLGIPQTGAIVEKLVQVNLLQDADASAHTLRLLAMDFVERPEAFSTALISDFGLDPLLAHQIRAAVMIQLKREIGADEANFADNRLPGLLPFPDKVLPATSGPKHIDQLTMQPEERKRSEEVMPPVPRPAFKDVVVNEKAKRRKQSTGDADHDYGLPSDYKTRFPTLALELEEFYDFMTKPSTSSHESPIRDATASVYVRHAKLFLGYHAKASNITDAIDEDYSLYKVFPTKEKESADPVLEFILWLRSSRKISVSYEANLLRGLTKLLKFRFTSESKNDPSYGEKAFDDIPLIREIRKLHREANQRQRLAPRSSDEKQKWLSWPEYLQVVSLIQAELATLIQGYNINQDGAPSKKTRAAKGGSAESESSSPKQRKIATLFQKYLILAIFASVPDRQRTIRELVVGRNFQKEQDSDCWCIRHAPEDYKTGKAYGERPPLQLSETLTPEIDDFLERWRKGLSPQTDTVFVQPRTGKPLTQDSVYQIVSRCCYHYMGKRTNPHLLRDMLVTHVRESNASEKQLEALALYMGHSIQMQRSSYDRRTLTKKVAPAVELMNQVNGKTQPGQ